MGTDEYGVDGVGNNTSVFAEFLPVLVRVLQHHIIRTNPYKSVFIRLSVGFMSVACIVRQRDACLRIPLPITYVETRRAAYRNG